MPHYLSARFDLIDQQIVDCNHLPVGRVDDVALELNDSGMHVAGLLCGQRALGARLDGFLGHLMIASATRLATGDHPPSPSIPLREVADYQPVIRLRSSLADMPTVAGLEHWLTEHLVRRIPGNRT